MPFDPEPLWPQLKPHAEAGDAAAMLALIRALPDDAERVSLYRFAIRKMAFEPWENRSLDPMIALADAAVAECERLGGPFVQEANVICYNTSANLADCWGDGFPRERRHFEKGLEYAKRALAYRERLGKGPGPRAMAWWAVGKHQQSLGNHGEAKRAFETSLEYERQAAAAAAKPAEISPDAPIGYLIAAGYLALVTDDAATITRLRQALRDLAARGGEAAEDASIAFNQLRETARLIGSPLEQPLRAD